VSLSVDLGNTSEQSVVNSPSTVGGSCGPLRSAGLVEHSTPLALRDLDSPRNHRRSDMDRPLHEVRDGYSPEVGRGDGRPGGAASIVREL
jgi:hypothetical protein